MSEATVTSKGQVTIPVDIRNAMSLESGERLVFTTLDDGTVVMRPKNRSFTDLKGLLHNVNPQTRAVPIDKMNVGQS